MQTLYNARRVPADVVKNLSSKIEEKLNAGRETGKYTDIKKFKRYDFQGKTIFSIRYSEKKRALFCLEGNTIIIIDWLPNHEYNDSQRYLEQSFHSNDFVEVTHTDLDPALTHNKSGASLSIRAFFRGETRNNNICFFDPDQESVLHTTGPLLIKGPPGSGKSLVLFTILSKILLELKEQEAADDKRISILFITPSPEFAQKVLNEYGDEVKSVANLQFDCLTFVDLLT